MSYLRVCFLLSRHDFNLYFCPLFSITRLITDVFVKGALSVTAPYCLDSVAVWVLNSLPTEDRKANFGLMRILTGLDLNLSALFDFGGSCFRVFWVESTECDSFFPFSVIPPLIRLMSNRLYNPCYVPPPCIGCFGFCLAECASYQTTSGDSAAGSSETVGEMMRFGQFLFKNHLHLKYLN